MSARELVQLLEELPSEARFQLERFAVNLRGARRPQKSAEHKTNGALDSYMTHPIRYEGFPPFNPDEIYRERLVE